MQNAVEVEVEMKLPGPMKPVIVLPKGCMSADDIQRLNDNGLCTVECDKPEAVRFLDPITSAADRPKLEQAAIELSRLLLHGLDGSGGNLIDRNSIGLLFFKILSQGTPLARVPPAKIEQQIFDEAKIEEIRRLAREEAKAERAAKKRAAPGGPKG